ncbi:hypothetical protein RHEC894_PE00341 (plasmid) [Rhizobium sp. CIAT894]|nr:hypothetical protein RHEC894_PE00341 [Rhizobium sp. CIAT894]
MSKVDAGIAKFPDISEQPLGSERRRGCQGCIWSANWGARRSGSVGTAGLKRHGRSSAGNGRQHFL